MAITLFDAAALNKAASSESVALVYIQHVPLLAGKQDATAEKVYTVNLYHSLVPHNDRRERLMDRVLRIVGVSILILRNLSTWALDLLLRPATFSRYSLQICQGMVDPGWIGVY